MMIKGNKRNNSLLYSYTGAFLLLFILTFIIISTLLLNNYISDLLQSYSDLEKYKISIAESEIDNCLELADQARIKITTTFIYHPSYYEREEYRKIEALKQLTLFADTSFFLKEYYLVYLDRGEVFGYDGFSRNYYDWISRNFGVSEKQNLCDQLKNLDKFTIFRLEKNTLWLCFPVRFYTTSEDSTAAFICRVDKESLLNYLTKHMGALNDRVALFYKKDLLVSGINYTQKGEEYIEKLKTDGFWVDYDFSAKQYFGTISLFKATNASLMILTILILIGVSCQMGYNQFSKVQRISKRIEDKLKVKKDGNELYNIEEMFGNLYAQKEYSNKQLYTQMKLLKQYLVLSLVNGKWGININEQLEYVNIDFEGKKLAVSRIEVDFLNYSRDNVERYCTEIENSSDDDILYYVAFQESRNEIIVIISLNDECLLWEAVNRIVKYLEINNVLAKVLVGPVYGDIYHIANSYMEATGFNYDINKKIENNYQDDFYNSKYFSKLEIAISAGNKEEANSVLKKVVEIMMSNNSVLFQKYMRSSILSILMQVAEKQQINLSQQQISNLLLSEQPESFFKNSLEIVHSLCENACYRKDINKHGTLSDVKNYIDEHFLDNNLTIESVADEFNISANYLSHAFKKHVGKNYKDYLLQLKVEYAKKLLLQDKSVTFVSQELGYANASYFIRIFKTQTGITPAQYQSRAVENKTY